MTVVAAPTPSARIEGEADPPSVPWRRMAWIIWRQHRVALAGLFTALGALAAYVWTAGVHLHHAYAAAIACRPAGSAACADLISNLNDLNHVLVGGYVLQIVPPLVGAFVGATVLARELETGTFRFAWTQGFGRVRWTLAKLVALAVVVTAAAAAMSVLFSWYYQPYLATGDQAVSPNPASPYSLALFDLRGVAFAAWTLVAFAIGGLAGMLIRRVVPAIVATMVAYAALALLTANVLRRHYLAPLLTASPDVPGTAWIYSQSWTRHGTFAFNSWRNAPIDLLQQCRVLQVAPRAKPSQVTLAQCFIQHGYVMSTRYQPAGRFWVFQGIEGGWLLALAALLIVITVRLVRRRAL
jgi:hypothetical protein